MASRRMGATTVSSPKSPTHYGGEMRGSHEREHDSFFGFVHQLKTYEKERRGDMEADLVHSKSQPPDAYGLEKLPTEELCKHYNKDFDIECCIGRFHNIYGPYGTWKGGSEKAPATICRKTLTSTDRFEM